MPPSRSGSCPQDIIAGIFFLVIGLAGMWNSFSYPIGTALQMGPGYFPALVFGLLAALGLAILVKGLLAAGPGIQGWAWRPTLLVLGGLVLFAVLAPVLGFVLSCMLLTTVATLAVPEMPWRTRLGLAAALTGFCWLIFIAGLGVLIPSWPELLP
ncbi:tripartite tricarboxylate transporter TctB family protein [Ancylobacter oerskovii]|uniref:Tripartite tricarboxylate transporter TctB family protein n=1 Tax=Ancylobacter oerskovii TaxID=459519 RepID=A0ABW4Z2Z5_9HYPH|nr:tripartite tricarboxylate transporter TctB family protein [Ancylobacter oerskovii]MBS7546220.1 tripartite tricarboxylate transporter TctB family protein [Ancylobacter oerskovii]